MTDTWPELIATAIMIPILLITIILMYLLTALWWILKISIIVAIIGLGVLAVTKIIGIW